MGDLIDFPTGRKIDKPRTDEDILEEVVNECVDISRHLFDIIDDEIDAISKHDINLLNGIDLRDERMIRHAPLLICNYELDVLSNQRQFDRMGGTNPQVNMADAIQTLSFSSKGIGSVVVFPSFLYHQVTPVLRGTRKSLVCWFVGNPYV